MANRNQAQVKVAYFHLKDTKTFTNGNSIPSGELLIKSSVEENGMCLYNTVEDVSQVRWFWANPEEVEFHKEVEEVWSIKDLETRRKMIEESWL
ncbi:MAG: hypothetical protein P8J32_09025 [bacterium]|nr:hypothetical protein [bacterium]